MHNDYKYGETAKVINNFQTNLENRTDLTSKSKASYLKSAAIYLFAIFSDVDISCVNRFEMGRIVEKKTQRQIFLMADRDIDALTTTFAIKHRDRLLQEKINLLEQKNKRIMELTRDCQQLRIALEQSAPNHRLLKIPK